MPNSFRGSPGFSRLPKGVHLDIIFSRTLPPVQSSLAKVGIFDGPLSLGYALITSSTVYVFPVYCFTGEGLVSSPNCDRTGTSSWFMVVSWGDMGGHSGIIIVRSIGLKLLGVVVLRFVVVHRSHWPVVHRSRWGLYTGVTGGLYTGDIRAHKHFNRRKSYCWFCSMVDIDCSSLDTLKSSCITVISRVRGSVVSDIEIM